MRMNRWAILAGYGLLAASTQLLWLTYSPITNQAHQVMGVSEAEVGNLALIFPLLYVLLALPFGRWLDVRFARALGTGAALTGGGGLLRLIAPSSFTCALIGQFVIAAGQPLVLNSITKVAARYFPESERTAAISAGSVSLYLGILLAALSGEPLYNAGGMRLVLTVQGVIGVAGAAWMLLALRSPAAYPGDAAVGVSLRWLRRDRFMWVLAGMLFAGMGIFNAVATWLQPILDHFGYGADAGNLIAVMTIAGIGGAAVLPEIFAKRDQRRAMLRITVSVGVVAFVAIALAHSVVFTGVALAVEGAVLLAALPVVLDWSESHSGPERAGEAVGFLLLAGNLGGVVLVIAVQAVIASAYASLGVMAAVSLLALALSARLPAQAARPDRADRR